MILERNNRLKKRLTLLFVTWVFSTACSSSNNNPSSQADRITITPSTTTLVAGEETAQLTATLTLSTGDAAQNVLFAWQSDDPDTISVNSDGLVTAKQVGVAMITATSGGVSGSATIWAKSPNPGAASLTLSGNARYEDRLYDSNGFTGTLLEKPIRNVVVEVVAIDGLKTLGTSATDENGDYHLTVDNSGNSAGVYLKVYSKTGTAENAKIEIKDNVLNKEVLWFISSGIDDSGGDPLSITQDVTATVSSRIGGAFNILDVIMDASRVVQNVDPCPSSQYPGCVPPLITVYWEPGSTKGSFYDDSVDAISLLGDDSAGGDTDEYDDSVIVHEYGHFIVSKFLRDDSLGGDHSLTESDQDIRLSWSEGWATFFAIAVLNREDYVDTVPEGIFISVNLEDYTVPGFQTFSSFIKYTTSEIAVSGLLWDLYDPVDLVENDSVDLSFSDIFKISASFPTQKPTTMETFWTQFVQDRSTGDQTAFQTLLQERQIKLFADAAEGSEPAISSGTTYTLYRDPTVSLDPVDDVDVFTFNVVSGESYTVETLNLTNGTDTFLTIKNASGLTIATNDNANGGNFSSCSVNTCPKNNLSNLASLVTFTATGTETYKAEVRHSENAPPSAGLLGTYEITVSNSNP